MTDISKEAVDALIPLLNYGVCQDQYDDVEIYETEQLMKKAAQSLAALRAALDEAEDRIRKICLDALISYGQVEAERDALAAQLDDANARADRLEAAVIAAAKIGQIVGFLGFDEARIEAFREDCGPDLWEKARAHLGAKP